MAGTLVPTCRRARAPQPADEWSRPRRRLGGLVQRNVRSDGIRRAREARRPVWPAAAAEARCGLAHLDRVVRELSLCAGEAEPREQREDTRHGLWSCVCCCTFFRRSPDRLPTATLPVSCLVLSCEEGQYHTYCRVSGASGNGSIVLVGKPRTVRCLGYPPP